MQEDRSKSLSENEKQIDLRCRDNERGRADKSKTKEETRQTENDREERPTSRANLPVYIRCCLATSPSQRGCSNLSSIDHLLTSTEFQSRLTDDKSVLHNDFSVL